MENKTTDNSKLRGKKPVPVSEQQFGEMMEKIKTLQESVDSLEARLFGNGKPGMVVDMASMTTTLAGLVAKVEALTTQTPDKWLIRHWKSILFSLTSFFLILHSIAPKIDLWTWFITKF